MTNPQDYYQELQRMEMEQGQGKLRTSAPEFSSTLARLPKLKQELKTMLQPQPGINYGELAERLEPALVKATDLLLELDLLSAPLRNSMEGGFKDQVQKVKRDDA